MERNNTPNSDLEQTMSVMRNAQCAPMVVIKGIEGDSYVAGVLFHHLFVYVNGSQFIKYTFRVCNGNDYLECVNVVRQQFNDLIIECTNAIMRDGLATMHVYAM